MVPRRRRWRSVDDGEWDYWAIAALSTLGVIVRPWNPPEATWAVTGAVMLIVFGLLPWSDALKAVAKGTDVCLFLSGMMLLAELARNPSRWPAADPTRDRASCRARRITDCPMAARLASPQAGSCSAGALVMIGSWQQSKVAGRNAG